MMTLEKVRADLLIECGNKRVGLWAVVSDVSRVLRTSELDVLRAESLALIRSLLGTGNVQAGVPGPDGKGFREWRLSPEQIVDRIRQEWDRLGRLPDVGEIVYFTAPESRKARD